MGNENVMSLAYGILMREREREKGGNWEREFEGKNSHHHGRLRIEATLEGEGGAWLVESYDKAADVRVSAVYPRDTWPHFVKLDPEHKLQIHEFLCQLGGGRFAGVKTIEQPGGDEK